VYFLVVTVLDVVGCRAPRLVVAAVCTAWVASCLVRDGGIREGNLRYQTLFWAPGSITHTVPGLALALLAAVVLAVRRSRWFFGVLPLVFVAGALIGTVTEIFTALIGAALTMILVARRLHRYPAGRVDVALLIGVAAMASGAAILLLSPGLHRRARVSPLSAPLLRAAWHAEPSLLNRALVEPWLLAPVGCGLLLGAAVRRQLDSRRLGGRAMLGWCAAGCLLTAVGGSLLTAVASSSGYSRIGEGVLSFPRTWGDFMLATGFAVFVTAACIGQLVVERASGRPWLPVAAALALGLTGWVLVLGTTNLHAFTKQYQYRATHWDAENARIIKQVQAGRTTVRYAILPFYGLSEPFSNSGRPTFAATCFAQYYDIAQVTQPRD
jgi:hypothetical protein